MNNGFDILARHDCLTQICWKWEDKGLKCVIVLVMVPVDAPQMVSRNRAVEQYHLLVRWFYFHFCKSGSSCLAVFLPNRNVNGNMDILITTGKLAYTFLDLAYYHRITRYFYLRL